MRMYIPAIVQLYLGGIVSFQNAWQIYDVKERPAIGLLVENWKAMSCMPIYIRINTQVSMDGLAL